MSIIENKKNNKEIIVGVDLDDTLYSFVEPLLNKYNVAYNDNLKLSDITDYKLSNFLKPDCKNIFKEFADKELFNNIKIEQYVIDELTKLNEEFTLYFVTAGAPITVRDRDKMLSRNIDWYTSSQLIICRNKELLKLDYLIDDCLGNVAKGSYKGILLTKPWNLYSNYPNTYRINGFNEAFDKIKWIEEMEAKHSE